MDSQVRELDNGGIRWLVAVAAFTVLLAFVAASCDSASPGYRTFTVRKGPGHYSFEYPTDFKKHPIDVYEDHSVAVLFHPQLEVERIRAFAIVEVYDTSEEYYSAETKKRAELEWNSQLDYELLEQSILTVDGVEADYRIYRDYEPMGGETVIPDHTFIARQVFFVVDGDLWQITLQADELTHGRYREAFDHVLQTFRILD